MSSILQSLFSQGKPKAKAKGKKRERLHAGNFVELARAVHGDRFSYAKAVYTGCRDEIEIYCKVHRVTFFQGPESHLNGAGCPTCASEAKSKNQSSTTAEFVKKARAVYGGRYSYKRTEYVNSKAKVIIRCKAHRVEFEQTPENHLAGLLGCPQCANEKRINSLSSSTEEFIRRAKELHGDRYSYDQVEYKNSKIKVTIYCKKHKTTFEQVPSYHLGGSGCPQCGRDRTNEAAARNRLSEKDYHRAAMENGLTWCGPLPKDAHTKTTWRCKAGHEWKANYVNISSGWGCTRCSSSSGEQAVTRVLDKLGLVYKTQKTFSDLVLRKQLRFDFYLPKLKIAIEYQGRQHYKPSDYFGGEAAFHQLQKSDKLKREYCRKHGIRLIEISYKVRNVEQHLLEQLREDIDGPLQFRLF